MTRKSSFSCRLGQSLALAASLYTGAACAVSTVTIESMAIVGEGFIIQNERPFFGSTDEVILDWAPSLDFTTRLRNWNRDYSGRAAAYCGGVDCLLDVLARPGVTVTLESFWLGGWINSDRTVRWSVIDLADNSVVLGDSPSTPNVSGVTGLTVPVNASSTVGLRIKFGPDGLNGGINDIRFSATPVPEPDTIALWALGLGAVLAAAMRRKHSAKPDA